VRLCVVTSDSQFFWYTLSVRFCASFTGIFNIVDMSFCSLRGKTGVFQGNRILAVLVLQVFCYKIGVVVRARPLPSVVSLFIRPVGVNDTVGPEETTTASGTCLVLCTDNQVRFI
jgi:hypothetical protein